MGNFEVVDIFNGIKDSIFVPQSYLSINKGLKNFTTYQISVPIPFELKGTGIDTNSSIISLLRNEINQHIYKVLLKDLFSTPNFDYFDISKEINASTSVNKIIDFVLMENYNYLMTNSNLSNSLCDSSRFFINSMTIRGDWSGCPYNIGSISNYGIFTDPFMKYDDNRICLFNNCEINIDNITQIVISEGTFSPKLLISYDLAFNIGDSKVIFIDDGENSTSYREYKKIQRDIKIDTLLDGSES